MSSSSRSVRSSAAAGALAAPPYVSFMLARLVDSPLSQSRAFVSELETAGQPFALLFRCTDLVSGVLVIMLAVSLPHVVPAVRAMTTAATGLLVAGVASIVDGLEPMRCSPSLNLVCRHGDETLHGIVAQWRQVHSISGVLGVLGFLIAMVAVAAAAHRESRWLGSLSWLCAFIVAGANLVEVDAMVHGTGVGLDERLSVLVIAGWLLGLSTFVWQRAPGGRASTS